MGRLALRVNPRRVCPEPVRRRCSNQPFLRLIFPHLSKTPRDTGAGRARRAPKRPVPVIDLLRRRLLGAASTIRSQQFDRRQPRRYANSMQDTSIARDNEAYLWKDAQFFRSSLAKVLNLTSAAGQVIVLSVLITTAFLLRCVSHRDTSLIVALVIGSALYLAATAFTLAFLQRYTMPVEILLSMALSLVMARIYEKRLGRLSSTDRSDNLTAGTR